VYVANDNSGTVSVINAVTNAVEATISVGRFPQSLAITPDGRRVYVASTGDDSVSVIDTATNTVTATITDLPTLGNGLNNGPSAVVVSPDGSRVYAANSMGQGAVWVIDTTTNSVLNTIVYAPAVQLNTTGALAISRDGGNLYVTNISYGTPTMSVINTANGNVSAVQFGNFPGAVAVSPDGRLLYATTSSGVSVIDTATNKAIGSIGGLSRLGGMAVSPDGHTVFVVNCVDAGTLSMVYV
jgi:YVTN family beta-propeller protein